MLVFFATFFAVASFCCAEESKPSVEFRRDATPEEVLDVRSGESFTYYRARVIELVFLLKRMSALDENELAPLEERLPDAVFKTIVGLTDSDAEGDEPPETQRTFLGDFLLLTFAHEGRVGVVERVVALASQDENFSRARVDEYRIAVLAAKLRKATRENDIEALRRFVDEVASRVDTLRFSKATLETWFNETRAKDETLALEALEKWRDALARSNDEQRRDVATKLEGLIRRYASVGKDAVVEGVCLDGSELDWNAYRGKVVVVHFFCGEIDPEVRDCYKKYRDRGLDVVSYDYDPDPDVLKRDESLRSVPWKIVSGALSAQRETRDGLPQYKDLAEYYGVDATPPIFIVDEEGKIRES